jgi:signal transduction histidine kinase
VAVHESTRDAEQTDGHDGHAVDASPPKVNQAWVRPQSPILVVDENAESLLAIERILEPLGHPVVAARSGEAALRCALRHDFVLALLDVQLAGMSGFDLASSLRSHEQMGRLPIIFLTGVNRDPEHICAAYSYGAVDYLLKPVAPGILRAKVKVFLELHHKQEQIREQATRLLQLELREQHEQRAREVAEAANHMKDEFLATISHELRTPLNAILGWARMLRTGILGPARFPQAVETIERSAQAQAKLINDILDVSRIVTGKLRLQVGPIDLPTIVSEAVETVRPAAEAKNIELRWDPPSWDVSVRGDSSRLQQIVWNLASNAVKFTPKGGRVTVNLERDVDAARLSVKDTGSGISPDFLPFVFDRFRQGNATTTRRHEGLGLGLSIVKHLTELHGGGVTAASAGVGQGAEFTVRLPVGVAPGDRHNAPEVAAFRARKNRYRARPKLPKLPGTTILFVDDHPEARALAQAVFTHCGARVITAETAAEALHALTTSLPDVLISDIGLPDEDGYALIRRVRALAPHAGGSVPAIALTAYARPEDQRRAWHEGFQMHLAKPVEPDELAALVASLIEKRPKRRDVAVTFKDVPSGERGGESLS